MQQFEDHGDWIIITDSASVKFAGLGTAAHKHPLEGEYYTINSKGECRLCKVKVPPGIRVKAMLEKL